MKIAVLTLVLLAACHGIGDALGRLVHAIRRRRVARQTVQYFKMFDAGKHSAGVKAGGTPNSNPSSKVPSAPPPAQISRARQIKSLMEDSGYSQAEATILADAGFGEVGA